MVLLYLCMREAQLSCVGASLTIEGEGEVAVSAPSAGIAEIAKR